MTSVADIDQERLGDTDPIGYYAICTGASAAGAEGREGLVVCGRGTGDARAGFSQVGHFDNGSEVIEAVVISRDGRGHVSEKWSGNKLRAGRKREFGRRPPRLVAWRRGVRVHGPKRGLSGRPCRNCSADESGRRQRAGPIAGGIGQLLFATNDPATPAKLEQAKKIFADLQQGKIDRQLFTSNANAYFSEQALQDFATGLGPLGTPQSFTQTSQGLRGGMTLRVYIVRFPQKVLRAWTYEMPDGKLEQYQIAAQN
jgi:hypothetical protein